MLHARLSDPFVDYLEGSRLSLSVADGRRPDLPLVIVNDRFCDLTGHSRSAVIGHNCRFLQPKSGVGPVKDRMRRFLADPNQSEARFMIANETKDGKPFVNLVYMAKLSTQGTMDYILGAQFDVTHLGPRDASLYDRALKEDIARLSILSGESNHVFLGSFTALASSAALIAQSKLSR